MKKSGFAFVLRQVLHDLRVGMLLRPALFVVGGGGLAIGLTTAEKAHPAAFVWAKPLGVLDVSSAQIVLGTIAGSMLTLLALVYSVFLVAMTLVSMQYSPRVLAELTGDAISQTALGMLSSTFLYALLVLRAVHGDPDAFVAPLGVSVALVLAVSSIGTLLAFLHHIALAIQANSLIASLADSTRHVISEEFPPGDCGATEPLPSPFAPPPEGATRLVLSESGYIQLLDVEGLIELARRHEATIELRRAVGEYVVEGVPIGFVTGRGADEVARVAGGCFDIGPVRTIQQDVEYGLRRIVDIGLKAISPAVNDPSTGVTCIDNLTAVLAFAATRRDPPREVTAGTGRVIFARTSFARLVPLAFAQLRQYSPGDMAVSLRLLRALHDLATLSREPSRLAAIANEAELLRAGFSESFREGDRTEFMRRSDALKNLLNSA